MVNVALGERADCLLELGRYDEAARTYEGLIAEDERLHDLRSVAVNKSNLTRIRTDQRRYGDALILYSEVLSTFQGLGEARALGITWHEVGIVHQRAGQPDAAEHAYRESLKIKVQTDTVQDQNVTLASLGGLYYDLGRCEDAAPCFRRAAEIDVQLRDLRREGKDRTNLGIALVALKRYDEARGELERAIECNKPFGHVVQPC